MVHVGQIDPAEGINLIPQRAQRIVAFVYNIRFIIFLCIHRLRNGIIVRNYVKSKNIINIKLIKIFLWASILFIHSHILLQLTKNIKDHMEVSDMEMVPKAIKKGKKVKFEITGVKV